MLYTCTSHSFPYLYYAISILMNISSTCWLEDLVFLFTGFGVMTFCWCALLNMILFHMGKIFFTHLLQTAMFCVTIILQKRIRLNYTGNRGHFELDIVGRTLIGQCLLNQSWSNDRSCFQRFPTIKFHYFSGHWAPCRCRRSGTGLSDIYASCRKVQ